jgi:putative sterol carrier protein
MLKTLFVTLMLFTLNTFASKSMIHEPKKRKLLGETDKIQVLAVFEANEKLHNSFFKYDAKKVEAEAKNVAKAIEAIKNTEVKRLLSFSKGKLDAISASVDRKKNNENYHLFSMTAIHILKSYDLGKKYNGYGCPMVKKKWVQNTNKGMKVYNPYDPSMPHCGGMETHFD